MPEKALLKGAGAFHAQELAREAVRPPLDPVMDVWATEEQERARSEDHVAAK